MWMLAVFIYTGVTALTCQFDLHGIILQDNSPSSNLKDLNTHTHTHTHILSSFLILAAHREGKSEVPIKIKISSFNGLLN